MPLRSDGERDVEVGRVADQALEEQVGATATALRGETGASTVVAKRATSPHRNRIFFITQDITNGAD